MAENQEYHTLPRYLGAITYTTAAQAQNPVIYPSTIPLSGYTGYTAIPCFVPILSNCLISGGRNRQRPARPEMNHSDSILR